MPEQEDRDGHRALTPPPPPPPPTGLTAFVRGTAKRKWCVLTKQALLMKTVLEILTVIGCILTRDHLRPIKIFFNKKKEKHAMSVICVGIF